MIFTREQIDNLVAVSDPDGVYTMFIDQGLFDDAAYVEEKYFEL